MNTKKKKKKNMGSVHKGELAINMLIRVIFANLLVINILIRIIFVFLS